MPSHDLYIAENLPSGDPSEWDKGLDRAMLIAKVNIAILGLDEPGDRLHIIIETRMSYPMCANCGLDDIRDGELVDENGDFAIHPNTCPRCGEDAIVDTPAQLSKYNDARMRDEGKR